MAPDEEILDFDIATSDLNPRIRVDLIATTRALYVFDSHSRQTTRLPYESIADVFWGGDAMGWKGRLILKTPNGGGFMLTMKRGYRSVGEIVERKVADQTLFERHVLFEGSQGATFRYRRFGEGQQPGWQVVPDQGVELDHPPVEAWAGETMRALKTEADTAVPTFQPGDPFVRHVALTDGGMGATFHLEWKDDGKHGWQWSYDEGLKDDLWVSIETEKAITKLEKELGLSLTWPHYDSAT